MRTVARISTSIAGGAIVLLALVGLAYTCWAFMTPMFAIVPSVPVGFGSVVAFATGAGLLSLRRHLRSRQTE